MIGRGALLAVLALSVGLLSVLLLGARPATATVPTDFEDNLVTSVEAPTALAFTPDGRMLIATKPGRLRVFENGRLLQDPALDISGRVCSNSERGLLGVAVDPEFATNGYVYLYYTGKVGSACDGSRDEINRVSRFSLSVDNVASGEKILVDNIPSPYGIHNAGDLHFGKDGYLYVSVGDGGCDYRSPNECQYNNDASRDRHVLLGKILRITRDGGIPPDNPYQGSGSGRCNVIGRTDPGKNCQESFARGLRNPFRMAFDPDAAGTRFRINEVGGGAWEEIDAGKRGADYAWNLCEGRHDNPSREGSVDCSAAPYTPPIHEYSHDTGCSSVTGGAFVPDGAWPASYDDAYLFGDYVCGKIFALTPKSGGGFARTAFATGLGQGGPIAMGFGPYKTGEALYYTTFAGGGEVRRLVYTAGNLAPAADVAANPPYSPPPGLTIDFDGSGSRDPDGDTSLTYLWNFGDGTTAETSAATVGHTYPEAGRYVAMLTVRDDKGELSEPDTVEVFPGNTPPDPEIEAPTPAALFEVGQRITLRGGATDGEDGQLSEGSLSWEVRRYHNGDHWHPYFSGTGNDLTFTAPPPEDLLSTGAGNYLQVRLTATDSKGLSRTVVQRMDPKQVNVRFATDPIDLRLEINGRVFRAPRTFVSWEGYKLNVYAPRQRHDGRTWVFRSWSDGRAAGHTITTPPVATTYEAMFERLRR